MRGRHKFIKYFIENNTNEGYEQIKKYLDYDNIFNNFYKSNRKIKLRLSFSKIVLTLLFIACSTLLFNKIIPNTANKSVSTIFLYNSNNNILSNKLMSNHYMEEVIVDIIPELPIKNTDENDTSSEHISEPLENNKLYEIKYSNEERYLVGYLDKNVVSALYEEWKKYNYSIRSNDINPEYLTDLLDDEEFFEDGDIKKEKVTGQLLYFVINTLDNPKEYTSQIKWFQYTDDNRIKKEINGLIPIAVIAKKEVTFIKEWTDNIQTDVTIPSYFFYSYKIDSNKSYLERDNQYYDNFIDGYANDHQLTRMPITSDEISSAGTFNEIFPSYFTKEKIKSYHAFSIVNIDGIDCVKVPNSHPINIPENLVTYGFESCLIEIDENNHYYSYNDFMEIYMNLVTN